MWVNSGAVLKGRSRLSIEPLNQIWVKLVVAVCELLNV